MRNSTRKAAALLLLAVAGCAASRPPKETPPDHDVPPPVAFSYPKVDGSGALGSDVLLGRPAVLIFITTYDLASQAQARFLSMVHNKHRGELTAAAIVLEPTENRPLVLAFRDALELGYPVAFGDADLIAGGGPFGNVAAVPTTLLLDARGRPVFRRAGLVRDTEIEQALRDTLSQR